MHLSARKLYRLQCCSVVSEQTMLGRLQGVVVGGGEGGGRGLLFIVLVHTGFLISTGSVVSKPSILGRLQGGCYGEELLFDRTGADILPNIFSDVSELRLLGRLQVVVMGIAERTGADFRPDKLSTCSVVPELTVLGRLHRVAIGGWGWGVVASVLIQICFLLLTGSVVSEPKMLGRLQWVVMVWGLGGGEWK